jgi:hypothetical protein
MCSLIKEKKSPKVWREGILLKRKAEKKTQLPQNTSQVLLYLVFQPNYLVDVLETGNSRRGETSAPTAPADAAASRSR